MGSRRRMVLLVFLPVAVAGLTMGARAAWDRWRRPLLRCPQILDLGEREFGETAVGRFTVANAGGGILVLKDFATSCSCAGVEQDEGGNFRRVEVVRLPPGEQVELGVRVAVGARPGTPQIVHVAFDTNDPARPLARIDVIVSRVRGGVYAQPSALIFGTVPVGAPARRVINLYDNGVTGRRIAKVHCTPPERFDVRPVPLSSNETAPSHETAGRLMARLEVTARTMQPGSLDGRIVIQSAEPGRSPDIIPVSGEVSDGFDCWPSTLVLPRRVGDAFLYRGEVLLRHREGKSFRVEVETLPPGISVNVRAVTAQQDQYVLTVERRPVNAHPGSSASPARIGLRVLTDAKAVRLQIPVLISGGKS